MSVKKGWVRTNFKYKKEACRVRESFIQLYVFKQLKYTTLFLCKQLKYATLFLVVLLEDFLYDYNTISKVPS